MVTSLKPSEIFLFLLVSWVRAPGKILTMWSHFMIQNNYTNEHQKFILFDTQKFVLSYLQYIKVTCNFFFPWVISLNPETSYNTSILGKYLEVCSSLQCKYDGWYLYVYEKEILKSKVKPNSAEVLGFM